MQRISAQESRNVGGAGQKIEATLLDGFELVHGSPFDEDEYVTSSADALTK